MGKGKASWRASSLGCQVRAHFGTWELKDRRGARWLDRSSQDERALRAPDRWSEGSWGSSSWDACDHDRLLPLKDFRAPGP